MCNNIMLNLTQTFQSAAPPLFKVLHMLLTEIWGMSSSFESSLQQLNWNIWPTLLKPLGRTKKVILLFRLSRGFKLCVCMALVLQAGLPTNAIFKQHSWCSGECCASVNCRPCAEHWCTASIIALPPSMEPKLLFMTLTHAVMGISLLHLYWACVENGNTDKYGVYPQHQ